MSTVNPITKTRGYVLNDGKTIISAPNDLTEGSTVMRGDFRKADAKLTPLEPGTYELNIGIQFTVADGGLIKNVTRKPSVEAMKEANRQGRLKAFMNLMSSKQSPGNSNLTKPVKLTEAQGFTSAATVKLRKAQQRFQLLTKKTDDKVTTAMPSYTLEDGKSKILCEPDLIVGGVVLSQDGSPLPAGIYSLQDGGEFILGDGSAIQKVARELSSQDKNDFHRGKSVAALQEKADEIKRKKMLGISTIILGREAKEAIRQNSINHPVK